MGSAADSLLLVVVGGFVLQGTGYGLLRPAVSTALADSVEEHDLGMAGAAERLIGQIGVVFGITVMASTYGGDVDQIPLAFGLGAVCAVLANGGRPSDGGSTTGRVRRPGRGRGGRHRGRVSRAPSRLIPPIRPGVRLRTGTRGPARVAGRSAAGQDPGSGIRLLPR